MWAPESAEGRSIGQELQELILQIAAAIRSGASSEEKLNLNIRLAETWLRACDALAREQPDRADHVAKLRAEQRQWLAELRRLASSGDVDDGHGPPYHT